MCFGFSGCSCVLSASAVACGVYEDCPSSVQVSFARVRMGDDPDAVGTPVCVLENMASSKVVMDEIDHLEAVANAVKNRMAFGGGRHET